ncbi:MAG TPA: extracellular solute-binding protein [Oligoflexus sp.]|uniref:sugar ABC transporter substrate-binding protein n=1 Tax=Oligoflexus sp. TaxID=1971216 RepID=UPI002D6A9950|nr:extracellular solute-binding protein [Oligoflexus sp.]HYX34411.1 extracellular solute-binding protein [Oligoflexus sp.]
MRLLFHSLILLLLQKPLQAQDVITLNLWEQDPPSIGQEIDKWIAVFQKNHPKIRIIRQHYENETLRTKFLRSAATGDGADIVYGPNDVAGVFAKAGVIQPVDTLFTRKDFTESSQRMTEVDGKIWGAPLSEGAHLLLYYRRSQVKEAPKTTKDLIEKAQAYTDAKSQRYGLAYYMSEPFWFIPFLSGFGGWPLIEKDKAHAVTIDTAETRQALHYVMALRDTWKITPAECDFDCAKSLFLSKRALFHISGDWELNALRDQVGQDLAVAPLPILSETGRMLMPMMGGRFLYVNATAQGPKLAAIRKFIEFSGSPLVQKRIAKQLASIPAAVAVRQDPALQSIPLLKQSMEAVTQARPMPPQVEMRAAWDGMRIMIQRALSGTESVERAAKTGQKAADEALAALRDPKPSAAKK